MLHLWQQLPQVINLSAVVTPRVNTEDLIDAQGVADILGLARRNSISAYQKLYPDMPRPVMDLGKGRPLLWLRTEIIVWAQKTGRGQPD